MTKQVSSATIDAIELGVAILGWYCAIHSPTPDHEQVRRNLELQLELCGLSGVTAPGSEDARRSLLGEVALRFERKGMPVLAAATRFGWAIGLADAELTRKDPELLSTLCEAAEGIGVPAESVRRLLADRASIRHADQADILIRHMKIWRDDARTRMEKPKRPYDLFVSHASEDKDRIARPLAEALTARGVNVWFDEAVLELGDSLRRKIDEGLAQCKYGVVILSPRFFAKEWPQRELDGLVAGETALGEKAILPIWHEIEHNAVVKYSPLLAGRLAAHSNEGIEAIVEKIMAVLKRRNNTTASRPP